MSPRPRTVSDAKILEAVSRAMSRVSPAKLTLAEVARDAGLSPATLVQRFGSKKGLLLALWRGALESIDRCFKGVREVCASPSEALVAVATMMTEHTRTPEEMANHLAYLQMDLSDPDFHRHILEHSRRIEAGYRALLDEAIAARELRPCDTARLARAIAAMSAGSLLGWAVYREGPAKSWVTHDLRTLLDPYRVGAGPGDVPTHAAASR